VTTGRALIDEAVAAGVDAREARWLADAALGDDPTERQAERFRALVARRLAGEPLQYVLGSWAFRRLDLLVDRRVLIPRPETEWVVEQALGLLPDGADRPAVVVDLGTGSGAIALAIADERWPHVRVHATDVSGDALAVARANLAGLGRRGTAVTFAEGSWWSAVPGELRGTVDLVVSNPPYVAPGDALPAAVADWEPPGALVPGPTGLEAIEAIAAEVAGWLRPGGWFVCEIGETQGGAATALLEGSGLVAVEVRPDLTGRDRMVLGQRPGASAS
jgi:release factor glutamine methyltransferase